ATLCTLFVCPSKARRVRPEDTSQRRTVLSQDPEASVVPSGLNTTLCTQFICPSKARIACPEPASQSRITPLPCPLATRSPEGLHATALHPARCAHIGATLPGTGGAAPAPASPPRSKPRAPTSLAPRSPSAASPLAPPSCAPESRANASVTPVSSAPS